jgi:hypothetical protein
MQFNGEPTKRSHRGSDLRGLEKKINGFVRRRMRPVE